MRPSMRQPSVKEMQKVKTLLELPDWVQLEQFISWFFRKYGERNIPIFGTKKAERFFKECGIKYQFINNDKNPIHLPRQCLRDWAKALILLNFLDESVQFTPYLHLWKIGSEQ